MTPKEFFQQIRSHLAKEDVNTALIQLQQFLDNSPRLDEVIQQAGRFAAIRKQIRLGTVSHADATLTTNQIRMSLIDLLTEIESTTTKTNFQKEAEQAAAIIQKAEKIYNIDRIDNANFS